jgi:pimeloyl-ACP methyl ester carboxylesterase
VRLRFKLLIVVFVVYAAGCVLAGVLLAELQTHPPRRALRHVNEFKNDVASIYHASLKDVSVTTADNVELRGWYVRPQKDNGSAVVLLHGVGDNREGVSGYARMFLDRGYRVLLPDARAHGQSGGSVVTYGIREADDIHRWVDWLESEQPRCVYGFGESMGAALLLQSLTKEQRFCAVTVESPFARFEEVAPERAAGYSGMPTWFGRTAERPIIETALLYCRWKYGVDLRKANPADAVAQSNVPVLLIAGTLDRDILPHHSEELARIDSHSQLWMVNGAAHGGAWGANPKLFEAQVTQFFAAHQLQEQNP